MDMFCDDCKHKPATVHLTQLVNGKKFDVHLCSECASKKGFLLFDQDKKFSIPNFLGSFLGGGFNLQDMHSLTHDSRCQNCGMVFSDIKQTGKLGCSQCYKAFDTELEPTLRRIHGNSRHVGKIPLRGGQKAFLKKELDQLKSKLQQSVKEEKYEQAAEIRDQIKLLEKQINEEESK
jgi:protein arginine kinase activator